MVKHKSRLKEIRQGTGLTFDTTEVRAEIEKKRVWLRDNEPEEYARAVGEDKDIFNLWKKKGYI